METKTFIGQMAACAAGIILGVAGATPYRAEAQYNPNAGPIGAYADTNSYMGFPADPWQDSLSLTNYNGGNDCFRVGYGPSMPDGVIQFYTNYTLHTSHSVFTNGTEQAVLNDGTVMTTGTNGVFSLAETNGVRVAWTNGNLTISSNGVPWGLIICSNLEGYLPATYIVGLPTNYASPQMVNSASNFLATNGVALAPFQAGTNFLATNLTAQISAVAHFQSVTNLGLGVSELQFMTNFSFRVGSTDNVISIGASTPPFGSGGIVGGDWNVVQINSSSSSDDYIWGGTNNTIIADVSGGSAFDEIYGGCNNNITDEGYGGGGDMIMNSFGSTIRGDSTGGAAWDAIINGYNSIITCPPGDLGNWMTNDFIMGPNVTNSGINNFVFNATTNGIITSGNSSILFCAATTTFSSGTASMAWEQEATNGNPGPFMTNLPWGSLCTTTNGQLFVLSNMVWILK